MPDETPADADQGIPADQPAMADGDEIPNTPHADQSSDPVGDTA